MSECADGPLDGERAESPRDNRASAYRALLHRRIRSTLQFLRANVDHVTSADPGDPRADKASCEIVLFCWALGRGPTEVPSAAKTIVAQLIPAVEARLTGPAIAHSLLWKPSRVAMLSMAVGLLNAMGRRHETLLRIAKIAWEHDFKNSREETACDVLEDRWSERLVTDRSPVPLPFASVARRAAFAPMMTTDDAYALTHTVFYLTDFGRIPVKTVDRARIWGSLETGILWNLVSADYDLLGEFILSSRYVAAAASDALRLGTAALFAAWRELGFVPSQRGRLDPSQLTPRPEKATESPDEFFEQYHPRLVGALLAAELLGTPAWRGDSEGRPGVDLRLARRLHRDLERDVGGDIRSFPWNGCASGFSSGGERLLTESLGASIAARALRLCPLSAGLNADLAITSGFLRRDMDLILGGLFEACAKRHVSATVIHAARWLLLVRDIGTVLPRDERLGEAIRGCLGAVATCLRGYPEWARARAPERA